MITARPRIRRLALAGSRLGAVTSAAMLILSGWALWTTSSPAHAAASSAGLAQIVTPGQTTTGGGLPLNSGGSSSPFTLLLPNLAACTGDSPNAGYRVQSFMVPSTVDVSTLTFGSSGPVPPTLGANFREPLFDTTGNPYVNAQTPQADTPGGPGPVVNIPTFNFAQFTPGQVPAGTYLVGIACTLGPVSATQLDKYWEVQIVATASTSDTPAGITWAVSANQPTIASTTTSTTSATGAASTTIASSGSSTTVAGTAVTGSDGSSTVAADSTTVAGADPSDPAAGTSGDAPSGQLASTGGNPVPLVAWSFLFLVFGRMAHLLARQTEVIG